jgi:hypothetical protein
MESKNELRATLEEGSFPLWVVRKYQRATGKGDRSALDFIIERWAMLEPSAQSYGVTLDDFDRERALAQVSPMEQKRRTKAERGATG